MIVARNNRPPLQAFADLMRITDERLNADAAQRPAYYRTRDGIALESDVFKALDQSAINTPFEGTIDLVSGAAFPDIVAAKYFGVEVKSTNKNHWTSTGSSILESTRIPDVEHIFLTFGKLGGPIKFLSRPYQDCMVGISVTHYPRYKIDMRLGPGETIFDKMGIPYDELRKDDNPTVRVSKYYKAKLKPGEKLWWATSEEGTSPILRLWTTLTPEQKNYYTVKGYALFPEILGKSSSKYQRYALWLASDCSVVNTNIRDQFSAGGKVDVQTINGTFTRMPAAFGRIQRHRDLIVETILSADEELLLDTWDVSRIAKDRLEMWCSLAADYAAQGDVNRNDAYKMLCGVCYKVL